MAAPLVELTEKDVQRQVKKVLALYGFTVSDFSQGYRPGGRRHGTTRQTKGIPDIYAQHPILKVRLWIEVKRPGGKVSPDQAAWAATETASGGEIWLIDSVDKLIADLKHAVPKWREARNLKAKEEGWT